jgi:hypothetical protein
MPIADYASDLRQMQDDFPSILQVGTRNIRCVASLITQEVGISEAGMGIPQSWDVIAVKADFAATPEQRQTVTLDGVTGQIDGMEIDAKTNTIRMTIRRT